MNIETKATWGYDDSPDLSWLGDYTDNPKWAGFVFDRKEGKLYKNGKFAGLGEKRYEYWSHTYRYIQCEGKKSKDVLQDVKLLERINDGDAPVECCTVSAFYNGVKIASASFGGIIDADTSAKAAMVEDLTQEVLADARNWLQAVKND